MTGIMAAIAGSGGSGSAGTPLAYTGTVTVATATQGGKGFAIVQHGYANAARSLSGSIIGSRSPTTTSGFTIESLSWTSNSTNSTTITSLIVTGDASARSASMTIAGANQNLGPGVFSGGVTTFSSPNGQANPFGADGTTPAIVLS